MVTGEPAERIEKYLREIAPDLSQAFHISGYPETNTVVVQCLLNNLEIRIFETDYEWQDKLRTFVEKCRGESG